MILIFSACRRDSSPNSASKFGFCKYFWIAFRICSTDSFSITKPFIFSLTNSFVPPTSVAMIGKPQAKASKRELLMPSFREGKTKMSACCKNCLILWCGWLPTNATLTPSFSANFFKLLYSVPSPMSFKQMFGKPSIA
ncbi:MAG: hypothetical protein EAZ97_13625 [Bacteroidetes bacterium]|nr:MAG: hypothetical protein EAZ97_13625 [Bacteroidota bacterium]